MTLSASKLWSQSTFWLMQSAARLWLPLLDVIVC